MSTSLETETKPSLTKLRFIFTPHDQREGIPEFLAEIISDSPYIFIEAVSFDQTCQDRYQIEKLLNLCLTSPNDLPEDQQKIRSDMLNHLRDSENFVHQLVLLLAGSGKQLFLVDVDQNESCFPLFEQANHQRNLIYDHLRHNRLDQADITHYNYVKIRAELHKEREIVVHRQITEKINQLKQTTPFTKAAVIQGLVHSPTPNLFNHEQFNTEIIFYPGNLPPEPRLWLEKRLGQEPTNHDYQRALILDFLFSEIPPLGPSLFELILNLDHQQISDLYHQFDLLYRQHLSRLTGRRRLSNEAKESYLPYAYSAAVQSLLSFIELKIH